jgi:outer membrane protein
MKRSLLIILILASGFALSTAAQTPPASAAPVAVSPSAAPAGPSNVAVISFQVAVAQTNEGQRKYTDLESKYAPRESALKALNDEIETLTKQLQVQGATLSDTERANRVKTIDEKKKKLSRSAEDLKTEGNQEIQQMYSTLAAKVFAVLESYSQQKGYTMVLDIGEQQSPVLYASPSLDITKAIVEAYNVKSGVPAPPARPAAAASPKPPATPAPKPPAAH